MTDVRKERGQAHLPYLRGFLAPRFIELEGLSSKHYNSTLISSRLGRRACPRSRQLCNNTRLLAVGLLLLCAVNTVAQSNKCALKLADVPDAPELFGFRIGMTTEQVKARVPRITFGKVNEFGVSKTTINPDFDPLMDKTTLAGIRSVSFEFLDGRVSSLWFGFDGSFKWQSVPEFVTGVSRSFRLPDAWTPWKTGGQQLKCADFQMTVGFVAEGPSFHIIDLSAERTIVERRRAQAEESEEGPETVEVVADKKEMIYYEAGCTPLREMKPEDRIVFESKEAAEKAGYKIARKCE